MSNQSDLVWMIGGPQGSGINLAAETFVRCCMRGGLHVFANIEYHSNIKGEHSYYRLRIAKERRRSHLERVDLLVALDRETLIGDVHKAEATHRGHLHEVAPGGGILFDSDDGPKPGDPTREDVRLFPIPFREILLEALRMYGREGEVGKLQIMYNVIGLGASIGVLGYDQELVGRVIAEGFKGRKAALADLNVAVFRRAAEYAGEKYGASFPHRLSVLGGSSGRVMMRGIQAVGMAKFLAGCGLQTYYPITPATDESDFLESRQGQYPIAVVQTEDEIAAVLMATGAAHAGLRASTSTSGPGFSLMAEGLGWAGITEAPGPVVLLYQRGGPATGLPTRTEQADIRFALHAAHGEFPRIVVAPGDAEECFRTTFEAFNWADRYQCPVVVVTDKFTASSYATIPPFSTQGMKVDRGAFFAPPKSGADGFLRYKFTKNGISPRSRIGDRGGIFWTSGDEHNERGHIVESADNRVKMQTKRMTKLVTAAKEIPEEMKWTLHGPADAEMMIVGWGSTKGAILDAIEELAEQGVAASFLQLRLLCPFPADAVRKVLRKAKTHVIVEGNYAAQVCGLIREMTGVNIRRKVLKFDGRPFSQDEVREGILQQRKSARRPAVMSHA
ncbi:MAG TPA: 2-oxoacid:acceptor oxidoreductase subunit alpha [Planctomycetota bacterium]|jgi:2-oxoglutarate ferredoxin oxidoreductase subunit alpha|nr:2-oxoacid:acceptor oxidoreductase subunit alpha [Planctomycetota bacterium]